MSNSSVKSGFVYKNGCGSAANPQNERMFRLSKSLTEKMLLLNVDSGSNKRWNFTIQEQSNEKYIVNLSENLSCNCQDFLNGENQRLCKHIIYVIGKLAKKRQLFNLHIRGPELKKQHFQEIIAELDRTLTFRIYGKRQEQQKGECQICFDQLKGASGNQCSHCKQSFHQQCLNDWTTYSAKCPICNINMGLSSQVKQEAAGRIYLLSLSRKQIRQNVQWEFYLNQNQLSFNRTVFVHERSIQCNCKQFQKARKPCKHIKFVILNLATFPKMLAYVENPQSITKKSIHILDRYLIDNFNEFLIKGQGIRFSKSAQTYKSHDQRTDNVGKCKVCFENMNFMKQDRVSVQHLTLCSTSGNAFHEDCIKLWRRKHNSESCPICSKEVYEIRVGVQTDNQQNQTKINEVQKNKGPKQKRLHVLNARNAVVQAVQSPTSTVALSKNKQQEINEANRNKREKKIEKLIEKEIEKRRVQGKLIVPSPQSKQKSDKLKIPIQDSRAEAFSLGTPTETPQGTPTSNVLEGCAGIEIINKESVCVQSTPRFNTVEGIELYVEDFEMHMKNKNVTQINKRNSWEKEKLIKRNMRTVNLLQKSAQEQKYLSIFQTPKDKQTSIVQSAKQNKTLQPEKKSPQSETKGTQPEKSIPLSEKKDISKQLQQPTATENSNKHLITKKKLQSRLENYLISKQAETKKPKKPIDDSKKPGQFETQSKVKSPTLIYNSQHQHRLKQNKTSTPTNHSTPNQKGNALSAIQKITPQMTPNYRLDQKDVQKILLKTIEQCSKTQNLNHQFIYKKLNDNLEKLYQNEESLSKQQMEIKKMEAIKILEKTISSMKGKQQSSSKDKQKQSAPKSKEKYQKQILSTNTQNIKQRQESKAIDTPKQKQKNGQTLISSKSSNKKQEKGLATQIRESQLKIMSGVQSKISEREQKQSHVKIQVFDIDSQSSDLENLMK